MTLRITPRMTGRSALAFVFAIAMAAGCTSLDAGGDGIEPTVDDDPLADLYDTPTPGSLDDLHRTIVAARCSGAPGLCHNGQFEPNLSTPALTYAYLVNRPSLEKPNVLRVAPGAPEDSVFIDKLRGRDVATMMPLGADPLTEDEIQQFEAWIRDGALRRPGAEPAPVLNNPPALPEIAVFDDLGDRLDDVGGFTSPVGTVLVLRHTVRDFETEDALIPFSTFVLSVASGGNVIMRPGVEDDPHLGLTTHAPGGPMGNTDALNHMVEFTIPDVLDIRYDDGSMTQVPATGQMLTPIALYVDSLPGGFARFTVSQRPLTIQ